MNNDTAIVVITGATSTSKVAKVGRHQERLSHLSQIFENGIFGGRIEELLPPTNHIFKLDGNTFVCIKEVHDESIEMRARSFDWNRLDNSHFVIEIRR
jgi:hypothetical protein